MRERARRHRTKRPTPNLRQQVPRVRSNESRRGPTSRDAVMAHRTTESPVWGAKSQSLTFRRSAGRLFQTIRDTQPLPPPTRCPCWVYAVRPATPDSVPECQERGAPLKDCRACPGHSRRAIPARPPGQAPRVGHQGVGFDRQSADLPALDSGRRQAASKKKTGWGYTRILGDRGVPGLLGQGLRSGRAGCQDQVDYRHSSSAGYPVSAVHPISHQDGPAGGRDTAGVDGGSVGRRGDEGPRGVRASSAMALASSGVTVCAGAMAAHAAPRQR